MSDLKITIDRTPWSRGFEVRMGSRINESTGLAIAQPVQFKISEPSIAVDPAFVLTQSDAQLFMDELWHVGIRPTEGTGSAGAMAAVQAHLKDMQRLVFDKPDC